MKLEELKDKRILILGFGQEGQDTYQVLTQLFPGKEIGVADRSLNVQQEFSKRLGKNTKFYLGSNYLEALKDYDVIFRSPGIPLREVKKYLKRGQILTSQTKIFFENPGGVIIGVTGTKGKGTTSTLIYEILKKAGFEAYLLGNIGKPALSILLTVAKKVRRKKGLKEKAVFVYEISSHQLQDLNRSPHIAVFLNLFPDHLEFFGSFKTYKQAKENILRYQTPKDFVVYNADDSKVKEIVEKVTQKTRAQKIPVSLSQDPWLKNYRSQLIGDFNKINIGAALKVARLMAVPDNIAQQVIRDFRGLPHRLEFVGEYQGIKFYNDSMATIPEATIGALEAFKKKVKTLIVGGSDKGADYHKLAKTIVSQRVSNLILLGQGTGQKIWQKIKALKKKEPLRCYQADSMERAVEIAFEKTNKGICLLSPASASFNLFSSYKERGDLFKRAVKKYGVEEKQEKN